IAAFELHRKVAAREPARRPYGRHGGFGAGVDQPHHFHARYGIADGFGQIDFPLRRRAEAGARFERLAHGFYDRRVAVPEQQRSPRTHVVDVLVAIDVEDVRSLAASDEGRSAALASEGAHGRVDPSRNYFLCSLKSGFGFSVHLVWWRTHLCVPCRDSSRHPGGLRGACRERASAWLRP